MLWRRQGGGDVAIEFDTFEKFSANDGHLSLVIPQCAYDVIGAIRVLTDANADESVIGDDAGLEEFFPFEDF
jgi:hypothetical protein